MTQFNEKTSKKTQELIVILLRESQILQKEDVFSLHLILKEIQVLKGKFTVVRWHSLSGFDINNVSKAEDFPI